MDTATTSQASKALDELFDEIEAGAQPVVQAGDQEQGSHSAQGQCPSNDETVIGAIIHLKLTKQQDLLFAAQAGDVATGELLHYKVFDISVALDREDFIKSTLEKLDLGEHEESTIRDELQQALVQRAAVEANLPSKAGQDVCKAEFFIREDAAEAENNGLYWVPSDDPLQVCNFVMRIDEQIVVHDADQQHTRFKGSITCHGRTRAFEMTAQEFASNEKLKAAIFDSAPPCADIMLPVDILRRAIIKVSQPSYRETTTAMGWTDKEAMFLVPHGHVDKYGYHDYAPESGVMKVDLAGFEGAQYLGMRQLDPEQLVEIKKHLATEFMHLNDRPVMRALLGAVALATLLRFASIGSRPVIWLMGLSGCGKTFLAQLMLNFFGDFPASAGNRIVSWNSTCNFLQSIGFMYKDCLFLIDDFKPETSRHSDVVRLVQNYADAAGRGRLRSDATMNTVRQIQGLLVATGEDFPMHTASGLARSIIVPVPNRTKDSALRKKCWAMAPLYRGLTADFIAHVIRNDRGKRFAERVEHWREHYYEGIAGQQNDARIAGNHALLVAAYEELAFYLGDVWPDVEEEGGQFVEDVAILVAGAVGAVKDEQPSEVFLEHLGQLVVGQRVRIDVGAYSLRKESRSRAALVGKVADPRVTRLEDVKDDTPIDLSISLALEQVQESLRKQCKPSLSVSEKTLINQLTAAGLLLDDRDQPINDDQKGLKSRQLTFGGKRARCVRMRLGTICQASELVDGDTG